MEASDQTGHHSRMVEVREGCKIKKIFRPLLNPIANSPVGIRYIPSQSAVELAYYQIPVTIVNCDHPFGGIVGKFKSDTGTPDSKSRYTYLLLFHSNEEDHRRQAQQLSHIYSVQVRVFCSRYGVSSIHQSLTSTLKHPHRNISSLLPTMSTQALNANS